MSLSPDIDPINPSKPAVNKSAARLAIGFVLFLLGIALFIFRYFIGTSSTRTTSAIMQIWEETSAETIKSLDDEIAQKTIELKSFQDNVASK